MAPDIVAAINRQKDAEGIWNRVYDELVEPCVRMIHEGKDEDAHRLYCNTECMQTYLNELSKEFHDDINVLICDGAAWHKAGKLMVPDNIAILFIPPYTPEMNPIEQIWKELRAKGFCNEVFASLEKVVDRLCETINHLAKETIISITRHDWISNIFNIE